jgi:hypothetical protein
MPKSTVSFFLVGILITGCVTIGDFRRLGRFNDTAADYRNAMRWSDFETANRYRKEGKTDAGFEKVQKLEKDIQIVSYDVLDTISSPDYRKVRQVVEINYYRRDHMIEKTIKAEQVWVYDAEQKRWLLTGDFPGFE